MKILILGGTGMLGHKLWQTFSARTETYTTLRNNIGAYKEWDLYNTPQVYEYVSAQDFDGIARVIHKAQPDVIINCIGIVKQQQAAKDSLISIAVNALFPHRLAELSMTAGIRLIHVSTDCVFSGRKGNYVESDISDAEDLYGRTKYLGEVSNTGCLTIRTSIIGYELENSQGLLQWFLSQDGKTVRGFTKAIFSGFTTSALANILWDIVTCQPSLEGIWHIAATPIDKYTLLSLINKTFRLNVDIIPDSAININRSLNADKFINATNFIAPTWQHMIEELSLEASFYKRVKRC